MTSEAEWSPINEDETLATELPQDHDEAHRIRLPKTRPCYVKGTGEKRRASSEG